MFVAVLRVGVSNLIQRSIVAYLPTDFQMAADGFARDLCAMSIAACSITDRSCTAHPTASSSGQRVTERSLGNPWSCRLYHQYAVFEVAAVHG